MDDKKTGEKLYPPELLRQWKTRHEGGNGPALAQLGPIDEDALTELLASAFEPPIKRLEKIADQLEKTDGYALPDTVRAQESATLTSTSAATDEDARNS